MGSDRAGSARRPQFTDRPRAQGQRGVTSGATLPEADQAAATSAVGRQRKPTLPAEVGAIWHMMAGQRVKASCHNPPPMCRNRDRVTFRPFSVVVEDAKIHIRFSVNGQKSVLGHKIESVLAQIRRLAGALAFVTGVRTGSGRGHVLRVGPDVTRMTCRTGLGVTGCVRHRG